MNVDQIGMDFHQVAALVEYPELLRDTKHFPEDARRRAQLILDSCGGNIGAYSHSMGIPHIRKSVAKFLRGMCVSSD